MRKKIGTTIRLTPTALERLAQLEINARREGIRGRRSPKERECARMEFDSGPILLGLQSAECRGNSDGRSGKELLIYFCGKTSAVSWCESSRATT